ncbi:MAG: hypothetical protein EU529_05145 [Promethearchaeota archaeon]|nr:MAG: hypothetical protein EU529_05145 [Candidatus Lokiarchaeota archaeon]
MVEKTKDRKVRKEDIDFCLSASEFTDITLTDEESENLIELMKRGPNEKAKIFSEEALKFYEDIIHKKHT